MMCATTAFLFSELRDLRLTGWTRVPDGDTPESAVVHRFARGLLVLELSDQLALRFAERMGDIRVVSDGHQRRMAGQPRAHCDPLLCATTVLQGDVDIDVTGIPLAQIRCEHRQRIQHERTLFGYEARSHPDCGFAKVVALSVLRLVHRASLRRPDPGALMSWSMLPVRCRSESGDIPLDFRPMRIRPRSAPERALLPTLFVAFDVGPLPRRVALRLFSTSTEDVERAVVALGVRVAEPHVLDGSTAGERHGNCHGS